MATDDSIRQILDPERYAIEQAILAKRRQPEPEDDIDDSPDEIKDSMGTLNRGTGGGIRVLREGKTHS